MALFKKKKFNEDEVLKSLQSDKYMGKLTPPDKGYNYNFKSLNNIKGFSLKSGASDYYVVIDKSGNAIDLIHEDNYESKRKEYAGLSENIKQKELEDKERKKTLAKRAADLGIEREENEKLLKELRSDSEKIDDRFNDAEKRYRRARKNLEDYVAGEIKVDKNRNLEVYQRKLRELQKTDGYVLLAQKEIDALRRFFKVSNALSGLSEELAASDQNYQPIDYNKKVQDIVTEPTGFFETLAGKTRRIPEGAPGSIYRNRIRDYKSGELSQSQELERREKAIERGKETIERGGNMWEAGKVAMETKLPEPEKTPYDTFSTDQLIELLIKENKKKTGK